MRKEKHHAESPGIPEKTPKVCMSLDILPIGQKTLPIPSAILIEDKAAFPRISLEINTLACMTYAMTCGKPKATCESLSIGAGMGHRGGVRYVYMHNASGETWVIC